MIMNLNRCKKIAVLLLALVVVTFSVVIVSAATTTSKKTPYSYHYDGMNRVTATFWSETAPGGRQPVSAGWKDIRTYTGGSFTQYYHNIQGNYAYGYGTVSVYGVVRANGKLVTQYYS